MALRCTGEGARSFLFWSLLLICCLCPAIASSSDCKVQHCSRQYSRAIEEDQVVQGATFRYCTVLGYYLECVRATARGCRGDLSYHTVQSLLMQWRRNYDCERVLAGGPDPPRRPLKKPPRGGQHGECAAAQGRAASHCLLFGDPHLRTFYDELQTCAIPGAWPLIDNPHLAVQVTNEPVGKGMAATAITKITVIIRQHGPCAQEKTYEAQSDFLPGVFADGSRWSGPGVRIREETPGKHVEIHLRYIAARVIIRQVGRYLTFAAKMPSAIALQGAESGTLELCVRGCPRRQRIDFERVLGEDSGPKQEAIATCRNLNITDFYFDACVFDLLTTGDGSFSAAARDAMLDAGQQSSVVNGTQSVVPRGLESSQASLQASFLLQMVVVGLILFLSFRVNR